ncbi:N-acetyltransferase [Nocardiopsis exhalans]|uniref:N-acetyltransferase n=1 Tax=Nocardiopsis exhalans TaxID=163604 RepID=A0ABY5DA25_9ACTN|nr:N-acetyltransferase [Nocardiopsis exhalans]USY20790.1 N-acetyltransferase [Nocardiopsis exhalans]
MKPRFGPVEPLTAHHKTADFDCGSHAQSDWLADHALQAHRSGGSRVYVVCDEDPDSDRPVVGYYALAAGSIVPSAAPSRLLRGAGRYRQPVVILTRLGVDTRVQGIGLGKALVVDALRRVAVASETIGVRALLIHCESESARQFYLGLTQFERSPSDPMHLVLLMKDLRHALT